MIPQTEQQAWKWEHRAIQERERKGEVKLPLASAPLMVERESKKKLVREHMGGLREGCKDPYSRSLSEPP